ncbi:MAG: efflux RND transporter permease subunit [Fidelibacterota bacterium]
MKLSEKAIYQPIPVLIVLVLIFALSIYSFLVLPLELIPDIEVPYAFVTATYPGAAPSEVESEIIKPFEDKISQLSDLEDVIGWALQNMAFITVEFSPGADLKSSIDDLKDKINEAIPDLPDEVINVSVKELDFNDIPITILNIFGELTPRQLREIGEDVKDRVAQVAGVNEIEIFGGVEREITINVDPLLLAANNTTIPQIIRALQLNNQNMPGGVVSLGNQDILVRTIGKFTTIDDLANIIIGMGPTGKPIRLQNIATVTDGTEDISSFSRYGSEPSVTLLINKKRGANIIETSNKIEAAVAEIAKSFPPGVHYEYTARQATDVERQNKQVGTNALWGIILVVIVLFFGIGFRNAILVSIALPFALMSSFLFMYIFDIDRTNISMFGLIMVLGIVVDGAIIVAEATYRHIEEGMRRKESAVAAMREVGIPIMTAVLTTIVAFAPIIYMSGVMGQFLSVIPKVVIFALIGAFIADHFLIPVAASKLMNRSSGKGKLSGDWWGKRLYRKTLNWALDHRWTLVFSSIFALMVAFAIVGVSMVTDVKLVKVQMFPKVPKPRIIIDISAPPGSQIEYTDSITREIEAYIAALPEVDRYVSTIGESGVQNVRLAQGGGIGAEIAQINVDLVDASERERSVDEVIEDLRQRWSDVPGLQYTFNTIKEGPPIATNVVVDISGDDLESMELVSNMIKTRMEALDGTMNIASSLSVQRTEFQVDVDHQRAAWFGVSASDISQTVTSALFGLEATQFTDGLEDIPVRVKLFSRSSNILDDIQNLMVPSPLGKLIPITDVATLKLASGETAIRHRNFKRNISVSCDLLEDYDATDIQRKLSPFIDRLVLPAGVSVEFGGVKDETAESFASLGRAMVIGFIIIIIILAAQFKSLRQPLIIAFTIPLSFIGVIVGLMITRVPFGMMAFFGVVALMGVVVNDAIVLISLVNDLRKTGMRVRDALIKAGLNRLRPIILTTITTLAGMIPLALNIGGGGEYWRPLSVSLVFGLAVSSFLTLVIVPVLYSLLESRSEAKKLQAAAKI